LGSHFDKVVGDVLSKKLQGVGFAEDGMVCLMPRSSSQTKQKG
jgi:hypothetical protein